jgi:hypothetical protein
MSYSPTYFSWYDMIRRCTDAKNYAYKNYGARNIKICKRWKNFAHFYNDMGERTKGMTLDRINNNKGYYPKNCKWSTPIEQSNNRRSNRKISFKRTTKTLIEWERHLGFKKSRIQKRLMRGWSIEKSLTTL